jgi:hypothetical protein
VNNCQEEKQKIYIGILRHGWSTFRRAEPFVGFFLIRWGSEKRLVIRLLRGYSGRYAFDKTPEPDCRECSSISRRNFRHRADCDRRIQGGQRCGDCCATDMALFGPPTQNDSAKSRPQRTNKQITPGMITPGPEVILNLTVPATATFLQNKLSAIHRGYTAAVRDCKSDEIESPIDVLEIKSMRTVLEHSPDRSGSCSGCNHSGFADNTPAATGYAVRTSYFGASEATIASKRESPRSGSHIGLRRKWP